MKRIINLKNTCYLCLLIFVLSGCDSKPVVDLFKKDLKVKVSFNDTDGLSTDSPVYMEDSGEKGPIGQVKEIETTEEGNKLVHLAIKYDYRKLIFTNTMFVLDNPVIGNEQTSILVATVGKDSLAKPLKSGTTVKGSTLTDYNIALAKKGMSEMLDNASVQAKKYLDDFNKYVESFDMDKFISQLDETTKAITEYSKEQKEKFDREILPQIEKLTKELEKKLEQKGDDRERKKLEKEYEKLKDGVAI